MGRGRQPAGNGSGSDTADTVGKPPSGNLDNRDAVDATADSTSARDAASALGLSDTDTEHFINGASAVPKPSPATVPGNVTPDEFRRAVAAYERRYGRRAAKAYARGGYWSILRLVRAGIAVYNIATGAGSSPVVQGANAAILASYWVSRWSK